MAHVLIVGCGYVGVALGRRLLGQGDEVWALRRNTATLPSSFHAVQADLQLPNTLRHLPEVDHIVFTAAPDARDLENYRDVYVKGLEYILAAYQAKQQKPKRIIFVSSTSVYGQHKGEWVDEESAADGSGAKSEILLEAERLLTHSPFDSIVLRCSGIYGPERTRLLTSVREGSASYPTAYVQYTNRIHRDDCAGALMHLLTIKQPGSLYIGSDHEPLDRKELLQWLARCMSAPAPKANAESQPRNGSNKRCMNQRLLDSGYTFCYPTYKEGYRMILNRMTT